jgi:hypothetical protein
MNRMVILALIPALIGTMELTDSSCGAAKKDAHLVQQDGPYVFYKNDKIYTRYIVHDHGTNKVTEDSVTLAEKPTVVLKVATDDPSRSFTVFLKDKLENEKPEYPGVKKQLVLSDIEGNFGAFRKLLQANGVIDSAFNWTFGDGHLVLIGDFVDRGEQVTEVLWLIYALEDKAKAAGGYVHYVLGNHEIMVLSGDIRYVHPKYKANSALLNEGYTSLFNEHTELGRWLRTKNIMEKVGDVLYTHGGISSEINKMNLNLAAINDLTRPYYSDSSYVYPDQKLITLFDSKTSPFWYRGYYVGANLATQQQVDSTLALYGVLQIATGHSIVGDHISSFYSGRVINTDLEHAKGRSEALLIQDGKLYRVNAEGKKELL